MSKISASPLWNLLLFILTIITVFFAGFFNLYATGIEQAIYNGVVFTVSLLGILGAHEAGHYFMAKKNNVPASLPYFIPMPPFISMFGTMGAVIVMKGRIRSRDALMEVGAAGPLAGMIVAIPVLFAGVGNCAVIQAGSTDMIEGQSILYLMAKFFMASNLAEGKDILLNSSPMAFAGWVGMLVTMLNLLPVGQLDGGHIFYAMFGDMHKKVSIYFHRSLFLFGLIISFYFANEAYGRGFSRDKIIEAAMPGASWIFLGILMLVLFKKRGFVHPHTDDNSLSLRGKIIGVLSMIVLILTFMPVIMRPVM